MAFDRLKIDRGHPSCVPIDAAIESVRVIVVEEVVDLSELVKGNEQTPVVAEATPGLPRLDTQGSLPPSHSIVIGGKDAFDLPKTLQAIQILRAWAALVVVIVHVGVAMHGRYGEWYLPGFTQAGLIGVDVFFCLSGFIMYYTSFNYFNVRGAWRTFLVRRFLRIYPIYWIVTIATLLVALWVGSHINNGSLSFAYLVKSFLLLPQERSPVVVQGWTLVHEVRFYAVFGLLLLLKRKWALWVLTAWGLASLGVLVLSYVNQALLDSSLAFKAVVYFCHPSSIQFVLGVWAAYVVRHCWTSKWFDRCVLLTGATATIAVMFLFAELKLSTKYYTITLFTIPSLLLVAGAALMERRTRPALPSSLVALGNASYSTYLIHNLIAIPVVWNLFPSTGTPIGLAVGACVLVAVIHGVGLLGHHGIEQPLHLLARRAARRVGHGRST